MKRIYNTLARIAVDNDNVLVFDIGSNVGVHAISYALTSENVAVHAFDPNPAVISLLNQNARLNGLERQIVAEKLALSNNSGTALLQLSNRSTELSSLHVGMIGDNTISVETATASDYMKQNNTYPDIVKIDVEGLAVEVLEGFDLANLSIEKRPSHFFIEIHSNENWGQVCKLMHQSGYSHMWTSKRGSEYHVQFTKNYGYNKSR